MPGGDLSDFEAEFGSAPSAPKPPPGGRMGNAPAAAPTPGGDLKSFETEYTSPKSAAAAKNGPPPVTPHGTFAEVATGAGKNFLPDLYATGADLASAVAHPIRTAKGMYDVGAGVGSKLGFGDQSPEAKARTEASANAIGQDFKDSYGSWDKFKNTMATHPVRPLMDASTLFGVGEATLPARAAKIAGQAARMTDPIQVATRAAMKVASVPQSILSGTPRMALSTAAKAGYDSSIRKPFLDHYRGVVDTDELPETIRQAANKIQSDTWANYRKGKSAIFSNAPGAVDLSGASSAVASARNNLAKYTSPFADDAREALDKVDALVTDWNDPQKPHLRTMEEVDKLRNEVGHIMDQNSERLSPSLRPVYQAIHKAMTDVDPAIGKQLAETAKIRPKIKDLLMTAGANPSLSNGSAIIKQLRLLRTAKGQDVLGRLAEADPRIPAMLAGKALHPWAPESGLLRAFDTAAGGAGMFALVKNPALWPLLLKGGVGALATASPKIAGGLQYGVSRLAHSPLEKGAYYAGHAANNQPAYAPGNDQQTTIGGKPSLFRHLLHQESPTGQFTRDGKTVYSPKGAIGAAQIMPGTAPEAAADAGMPLDMDRLQNDPEYNVKLGEAHFNKLANYFGDQEMALAAYNAGKHRTEQAITMAQNYGGDWKAYLPAETRDYIAKITLAANNERPARASGGRTGIDHEAEAEGMIRRAESIKKGLGKVTEPLLNASDDHIAKALSVANESI